MAVTLRIDGDSRGAERAVKNVRAEMKGLGKDAKRAQRDSRGRGGDRSRVSRRERAQTIAEQTSRLGGAGGGLIGGVAATLGSAKSKGAIALGVGAVAVAGSLMLLNAAVSRATEQAKEQIAIERRLTEARKKALEQANQSALGRLSDQRAVVSLLGGQRAQELLAREKQGLPGLTSAAASLARSGRSVDPATVEAIATAVRTGLVDAQQAAGTITGSRIGITGDANRDAQQILTNVLGRRVSIEEIARATDNLRQGFAGSVNIRRARGSRSAAEGERLLSSGARIAGGIATQAAAIRQPELLALAEVSREAGRELLDFKRATDLANENLGAFAGTVNTLWQSLQDLVGAGRVADFNRRSEAFREGIGGGL